MQNIQLIRGESRNKTLIGEGPNMNRQEIFSVVSGWLTDHMINDMSFNYQFAEIHLDRLANAAGLVFEGAGNYSVVVSHPSNLDTVYKVSCSRFDGYRAFSKFIETLPAGNPYLPVIIYKEILSNLSFYEIERLTPVNKVFNSEAEFYNGDHLAAHCWHVATRSLESPEFNVKSYVGASKFNLSQDIKDSLESLSGLCRELRDNFKGVFTLDLHEANIMFRGDQFVITDPIGGNKSISLPF